MNSEWQLSRIGLLDFWYYDIQEFEFSEGRMLLRGANGSGKSVTMQSFIPLLLDGNMRPERLDPFGSRARKMENYLLEEGDEREERTGYLYMELKRKASETYTTIGIGMRARKNKKMDTWYFAVTDGRRIGKDLFLYKDLKNKITCTKQELKNRLDQGGYVMETQGEYAQCVNRLLFGFDTMEEYLEMLELLIQLRTPKLSKDFKPSVINEILSRSLQTLSEDDLRPMSEAIENMDNQKTNLQALYESVRAAEQVEKIFDQYNEITLYEKAMQFRNSVQSRKKQEKSIVELEKRKEESRYHYQKQRQLYEELEKEEKVLKEEENSLKDSDAAKLKQRQIALGNELIEAQKQEEDKKHWLSEKEEKYREIKKRYDIQIEENELLWTKIKNNLTQMEELMEDIPFDEVVFLKKEVETNPGEEQDFQSHRKLLKEFTKRVQTGKEVLIQEKEIREKLDKKQQEADECRMRQEKEEKEYRQYDNLMFQAKNEFIEKFYLWAKENRLLKIQEEVKQELTRRIEKYSFGTDFSEIRSLCKPAYDMEERNLEEKLHKERVRKEQLEQEAGEIEGSLLEWKGKKEPEPPCSEPVKKSRQLLEKKGIPYLQFYKVVDFSDKLSEEQASRLEESLSAMGILDALIVPPQYREQVKKLEKGVCDRYIFGDAARIKNNLLDWLDVDNGENDIIKYQSVAGVLSAIGIGEGEGNCDNTWIDRQGNYKTGIVEGTITGEYRACFIGLRAREKYRQEQIGRLEALLEEKQSQLKESNDLLGQYEKEKDKLLQEWSSFPSDKDLKEGAGELYARSALLENIKRELEGLRGQLQIIENELVQIELRVREVCSKCYLTARLDIYRDALDTLADYQEQLLELEKGHEKYLTGLKLSESLNENLLDLDQDLENIRYEMGRLGRSIRQLKAQLLSVEEQLALTDYEKIKERLDYCMERLPLIPKEKEEAAKAQTRWQLEEEGLTKEIFVQEEEKQRILNRLRWLEQGFQNEYSLEYVERLFIVTEDMEDQAEKVCNQLAEKIRNKKRSDLQERLQAVFHENKGYLLNYQPTLLSLFTNEEEAEIGFSMRRTDIAAKYRGTNIRFKELVARLKEEVKEQEYLLSDKERELFEDILANTISKKIRGKIHASNRWVDKMNQLMGSMKTSSGLKLSLRWKQKRAEQEGQLDTRELVDLLSKDSEIMRMEELEKLSLHFRTKIQEARRLSKEGDSIQSFHAIMREVLDYRKWFEFTLECEKTGEKKREMTDRVFFTFSGGEKAMSMYVPLFSAVVAKYAGAREDAPRLISLDEAFAGVDETNIRDMFRLMVECKFNFMLNSQVLWGDYDTVPALAIYQLLRPENAKFVTVISYLWNGREKQVKM